LNDNHSRDACDQKMRQRQPSRSEVRKPTFSISAMVRLLFPVFLAQADQYGSRTCENADLAVDIKRSSTNAAPKTTHKRYTAHCFPFSPGRGRRTQRCYPAHPRYYRASARSGVFPDLQRSDEHCVAPDEAFLSDFGRFLLTRQNCM
jgi:hypothetical protein